MTNLAKSFAERRRESIGGTDVAAIVGVNPFKTALDVYNEKINGEKVEENEYMIAGTVLEDGVSERFFMQTDYKPIKPRVDIQKHHKYPFFHASIDRLIMGTEGTGILECKTTWKTVESKEQFIKDHPHYYCQVQWYLMISGLPFAYFAVYSMKFAPSFHFFKIDRNEQVGKTLLTSALKFWEDHIEKQIPPKPQNGADVVKLYPNPEEEDFKQATDEDLTVWTDLVNLKKEKKVIDADIKELEEKLKLSIGEHEAIINDERLLATFKGQDRNTIDSKKLKEEKPDIYNQYIKTSHSRTLRVKER